MKIHPHRTLNLRPKTLAVSVYSRHPSHNVIKRNGTLSLNKVPLKTVVRLGSLTNVLNSVITINSIEGIKNSSNKRLMKECFDRAEIQHALWFRSGDRSRIIDWANNTGFPIISKSLYGSKNIGNIKHDNVEQLQRFLNRSSERLENYIFEKFYNYTREYRLHVSKNGCFYACRKMLKSDTLESDKWHRHDSNCVWIMENNPLFDKPVNWNSIVENCKKALLSLNLDVAGFDVKIQSAKDSKNRTRLNPEYIIIESNSACSFGNVTAIKYQQELNNLISEKVNEYYTRINNR